MFQDFNLDLKTDNAKACFILSGISFRNLGPKLDIVSVPKCTEFMFLLVHVYHSLNCAFRFLKKLKLCS